MKKLIGLSLSLCVIDIIEGKVNADDVICIVTSTAFSSPEEAVKAYGGYWESEQTTKEAVLDMLQKLWPIVFQPRMIYGGRGHMISAGYWYNVETGE